MFRLQSILYGRFETHPFSFLFVLSFAALLAFYCFLFVLGFYICLLLLLLFVWVFYCFCSFCGVFFCCRFFVIVWVFWGGFGVVIFFGGLFFFVAVGFEGCYDVVDCLVFIYMV